MQTKTLIVLTLIPLLAACASSGTKPAPAVTVKQPKVAVRTPVKTAPSVAQIQAAPGLEGVIGADADSLTRQFGAARLEVWEGDARKLQFSGSACVLDVFLYPAARGGEPQASYVEARRASDGQEVDRAACVSALRKKQG